MYGCPYGCCGCGIICCGYDYVPASTRSNGPTVCFNFIHQTCSTSTLNFWLNPDTASGFHIIASTANAGSNAGYNFFTNLNDWVFLLRESVGSQYMNLTTTCNCVTAGVWSMLTMTVCEACSTYRMYLDGCTSCPIASDCCSTTTLSNAAPSHKLADNSILNSCGYNGQMDEVSIWQRVLTTCEISDLYNCGSGLDLNA